MTRPIVLSVSKVVTETPDAVTLHFFQPKVNKVWYKPGQYLPIAVEIDGEKHYRSYSICTIPQLDDTLAVTVKRVPGGRVSNYLNDHVKEGDKLEAMRPVGRFFVENSVKEERHLYLFGAGSGITPLMSILRSVLYNEPRSAVSLVYVNRDASHIIFYEELLKLEARFPDRLRISWHLTASQGILPAGMQRGRLRQEEIARLLETELGSNREAGGCYLCGPEGFMDTVEAGLLDVGVAPEEIYKEHFSQEQPLIPKVAPDLKNRRVEVLRGDKTYLFLVPAGARILDSALQQGVPLPYSCRRGECTTCMCQLLSGEVRMERNEALTDEELNKGLILSCQAYPLTDGIRLRV